MNIVSGSYNLWRLLGEYEPLYVLHQYYKRTLNGFGGAKWPKRPDIRLLGTLCTFQLMEVKMVKNTKNTTFRYILQTSTHKTKKLIQFLIELTYGEMYFFRSIKGFSVGQRVENCQNGQKYHRKVHFLHFHFTKLRNEHSFWQY